MHQKKEITFKKTDNFDFPISQTGVSELTIAQNEISFNRPYTVCSLNSLTNQMTDFLFEGVYLIHGHNKIKVDMLGRPVRWKGYPYPLKTVFQIVPHDKNYSIKLTHNSIQPISLYTVMTYYLKDRNTYKGNRPSSGPVHIGKILRSLVCGSDSLKK